MKNAIVAAIVSALVATGLAGASSPTPVSPEAHITWVQYNRLKERLDNLQTQINCFQAGAISVTFGPDPDEDMQQAQGNDPAVLVPTVNPQCVNP